MTLLALIGITLIAKAVTKSPQVYWVKWQLAKYKIRYVKDNIDLPIGTQIKPLKPFDCAPCLSFWFSLITMVYSDYNIAISFGTAYLIYKIVKKYYND
jgi:hypothetical protein